MPTEAERAVMTPELHHEIEQFLYREAELLDEGRFHEWLDLFAADVHYWMPTRRNRSRRERAGEFGGADEIALFDDDKRTLVQRVKRLDTGLAWAEDPPSRTRHVVSNVRVRATAISGEYEVSSYFILYRTRLETDQDFFIGGRRDVLRRTENGFVIARRTIHLDQSVLLAKNLSVFF